MVVWPVQQVVTIENIVVLILHQHLAVCCLTPEIMCLRCEWAFMVACVALPAASSFYLTGRVGSSPTSAGSNPSMHCSPPHRRGSSLEPIRMDNIQLRKRMLLNMRSDSGVGEGGDGPYKMPPRDEYNPGSGGVASSWPARDNVIQDGFGEGIPRLNTVVLTGYLGQDPKPRYFDSGKVVLNLSLAVKREYHPIERKAMGIVYGEEETDWFQLEMWNRDAEYAAKVCRKGGRVGVTGPLHISEWTDKEGNPRTTVKILVQSLEILDSRAERASRSDNSEDNLWESERLQKADAAAVAQRQVGGIPESGSIKGGGVGGGRQGGAYQRSDNQDLKARKKTAEDKWWSAEADTAAGVGGSGEPASWWDEGEGAGGGGRFGADAGGARGVEPDSLPSFFDG